MYNFDDRSYIYNSITERYISSPTLSVWAAKNIPRPELFYASGIQEQKEGYCSIANDLNLQEPRVLNTHMSKSVTLPVVAFKIENGFVLSRNNFYDVKGVFILNYIPDKLLHDVMLIPSSEEDVERNKERCINYSKHTGDEEQYQSDAWMQDWSGDQVIRYNDKIYIASGIHNVYFEGINKLMSRDVFVPYDVNKNIWASAFHLESREVNGMDNFKKAIASLIE